MPTSPTTAPTPASPPSRREVLARFHRAMLDVSADDLADLYAVDGVHEFPFFTLQFPERFEGREQIRAGYRAAWDGLPVAIDEIRDAAVYEASDPEVIIGAAVVTGTLKATGAPFSLPGLLILRVRDGQIVHTSDYMDNLGVARQLGRLGDRGSEGA